MSDLISASSLLMAVVAVLFSLWYGELNRLIQAKVAKYADDNKALKAEISNALLSKSLPLAIISVLVPLTFAPIVWSFLVESWQLFNSHGLPTLETYDAAKTAFCLVFWVTVGLAIYSVALLVKLEKKRQAVSQ
ncbi:hypothetical protein [Vibrio vulnificus]|uniref:hypothetical protein n=1 Tax=Vibrio vulnificus TaxID=672 RepID=UPI0032F02F1B